MNEVRARTIWNYQGEENSRHMEQQTERPHNWHVSGGL